MDIAVGRRRLSESSDTELSEDEIQQLLAQAEERLRVQASSVTTTIKSNDYLPRSAKLDISTLSKSYIHNHGEIAHADARRLLDDNQRRLANGFRKVEDPVALKRRTLEVSDNHEVFDLPVRKIFPFLS